MIGGAFMPKTALPTPATVAHEPHPAHPQTEVAHDVPAPRHEHDHDETAARADTPARDAHASKAHATTRNARRARGVQDDTDRTPARDAFARLLDQAPVTDEGTKTAAATAAATSAPEGDHDARRPSATEGSLPDQLLGLLASLAPGAQPATPTTAAAAQTSVAPAPTATAPAAKPATPPLGADAAGILLPTLQAAGSASAAATTATAAALAGMHSDETGASAALPTLRDANHPETPAPTPFDALVRATAPTAPDAPRPVVPATPTAVMQPTNPRAGYGEELGTSVMWMADQRISHAEVRVVPEHLGPIDVRLQLDGAQVHATFLSAQPEVRHALEASLPRLRDMLGQHGLQLANADVGQRQQDPRATRSGGQATGATGESGDDGLAPMTSTTRTRVVRGLLDEYA